ncbi:MAG TPA: M20/M25/M40 family metallo-hydrolase [Roseiflexaceae bacterium]|nr:M20/M25/M40 family metallo-hydrolase [Roseiflexaceae bacterium]
MVNHVQVVDAEEAATLTAALVAIRSYPGEEAAVQQAVAGWLIANGIPAELQPTAEANRPNVLARLENGPGPTLLLNGHVDTVLAADGWTCDPWQGKRDGDRLYGLGALDMKAGVAAMLLAARTLHQQRDTWRGTVIVSSVVDEEAYSIGARALVDQRIAADYCIVTESAWQRPVLGAVGKVLVRADITGKAAHGSMPDEGINAAVEAARLVAMLDTMPLGHHPRLRATQCVLSLHSGNAQYVITVPEHAQFTINRHIVPGETDATVLAEMHTLATMLNSPAQFTFAVDPPYYPPWEISADHPFVQRFAAAYMAELGHAPQFGYGVGVADTNYFAADLGIPSIQFGPHGANFHQCDEWVDVPSIAGTVRIIVALAQDLLAPYS